MEPTTPSSFYFDDEFSESVHANALPVPTVAPIVLLSHLDSQPVSLDKKIRLAEDKLSRIITNEEQKTSLMTETATRLTEEIIALRQQRERWASGKDAMLIELRNGLAAKLNSLSKSRQINATKLADRFGTDIKELTDEVGGLRTARDTSQAKYARKIGEEVARIAVEFEKQKELRNAHGERIASTIYAELQAVQAELSAVKEARTEGENELLKTVEEMCLRIRGEINNERILREHGEEQLLQLLEETCCRVEANFQVIANTSIGLN